MTMWPDNYRQPSWMPRYMYSDNTSDSEDSGCPQCDIFKEISDAAGGGTTHDGQTIVLGEQLTLPFDDAKTYEEVTAYELLITLGNETLIRHVLDTVDELLKLAETFVKHWDTLMDNHPFVPPGWDQAQPSRGRLVDFVAVGEGSFNGGKHPGAIYRMTSTVIKVPKPKPPAPDYLRTSNLVYNSNLGAWERTEPIYNMMPPTTHTGAN